MILHSEVFKNYWFSNTSNNNAIWETYKKIFTYYLCAKPCDVALLLRHIISLCATACEEFNWQHFATFWYPSSEWMLYWSTGRQTVTELSDCNNFELNIFILYIPSKSWKPLYVDYMQISIEAVAILSPISGTEQYRILSLHIIKFITVHKSHLSLHKLVITAPSNNRCYRGRDWYRDYTVASVER
jgi:hypothetical protein